MCITATVMPATMSPKILFLQLYEGSQSISGIVFFKNPSGSILLHLLDTSLQTAERQIMLNHVIDKAITIFPSIF